MRRRRSSRWSANGSLRPKIWAPTLCAPNSKLPTANMLSRISSCATSILRCCLATPSWSLRKATSRSWESISADFASTRPRSSSACSRFAICLPMWSTCSSGSDPARSPSVTLPSVRRSKKSRPRRSTRFARISWSAAPFRMSGLQFPRIRNCRRSRISALRSATRRGCSRFRRAPRNSATLSSTTWSPAPT